MTKKIAVSVLAMSFASFAQNISLTGTVTNASNGALLQGVVVTLGNTPGPIDTTKADGTYHLSWTTTGADHRSIGEKTFSGSRLTNGLLEFDVTQREAVTVESFGMNGVLLSRFVHGIMPAGHYQIDVRGSGASTSMRVLKVRQGDNTAFYPVLPMKSWSANSIPSDNHSTALSKSAAFSDTLIFTQSGFVTAKKAVTAPTGVNDVALSPVSTGSTVTDTDGNVYHTITINNQVWMVENLKTTKLNDGSPIQQVPLAGSWASLGTPAYCWYNNDAATYKSTYGAYYNFFAVDTRKLAPTGWHVPSYDEWNALVTYLGGNAAAGGVLKETGTTHWTSPNNFATNTYGFTALPGGARDDGSGNWFAFGTGCYFWSSTATGASTANDCRLYSSTAEADVWGGDKRFGYSVRCIKD